MKTGLFAAIVKGASLLLFAQSFAAGAAEVRFFTGGGFRSVTNELAPAFERATGHKLVATFDSEGEFRKRISAGESFDVLLIGPALVDPLIRQGKIVADTRAPIARAGIGAAVPAGTRKPDIGSVDAFKRTLLDAKAVAYVGEGHSGEHFAGVLDRLGIAGQMKPKLKPLGVAEVAKAGASGAADLVVWVVPGILAEPGVDLTGPLPAEFQTYINLTAGLSTTAKEPDAGKALIQFLQSDAAAPVIKAKGWEPPSPH